MATDRLYNILNITGVPLGGTVSFPHLLRVSDDPIIPDRVDFQFPEDWALVSGDATTITVRNIASASGSTLAWVFAIHPVTRSFGLQPDDGTFQQGLVPRPFSQSSGTPSPPFPNPFPVDFTLFARLTGNDVTGNGTLANPYRTFQRAVLDMIIDGKITVAPGFRYNIDATGTGPEAFPAGYQFPAILAPAQLTSFGDPATAPFLARTAFNVFATPQPATGVANTVPGSDIVSIIDTAFGLATVTTATPRPSWAANALKGKMCIGGGTNANTSCVIYGSDATHLFLCNTAAAVTTGPQQDLFIVEPSATWQAAGPGVDGQGIESVDATSFCLQGIAIECAGGGVSFLVSKTLQPFFELCDFVNGLSTYGGGQQVAVQASVIRAFTDVEGGSSLAPRRSLFLNSDFFIIDGGMQVYRQTVLDGNLGSLGPATFATNEGGLISTAWEFVDCLFTASAGANGAVFARGGGSWSFQSVQINGSTGDAINATGYTTLVATNLTGTLNGGFGVHMQDSASLRVTDNATVVTGTGGDMKAGTKAARTWADFRANPPVKNELDLVSPPVGDETTGAGTGGTSLSRIFQRP